MLRINRQSPGHLVYSLEHHKYVNLVVLKNTPHRAEEIEKMEKRYVVLLWGLFS